MNENLKRCWQGYQRRRVVAIRSWFQDHNHEAYNPMINYIVHWLVDQIVKHKFDRGELTLRPISDDI